MGSLSDDTGRSPRIENALPPEPPSLVGRDETLGILRAGLRGGRRRWVLTGPDGIGKSALAEAHARRYAADYDVIWWVPCGDEISLARELSALGVALEVSRLHRNDGERLRCALAEWLKEHDRWLLIFDGVSDPTLLARHLPSGGGDVIATATSWPAPLESQAAESALAGGDDPRAEAATEPAAVESSADPSLGFEVLQVPPLSRWAAEALIVAEHQAARAQAAAEESATEEESDAGDEDATEEDDDPADATPEEDRDPEDATDDEGDDADESTVDEGDGADESTDEKGDGAEEEKDDKDDEDQGGEEDGEEEQEDDDEDEEDGEDEVDENSAAGPSAPLSKRDRRAVPAIAKLLLGTPAALRMAARSRSLPAALAGLRATVAEIYEDPEDVDAAEDIPEALEFAWTHAVRRVEARGGAATLSYLWLFGDTVIPPELQKGLSHIFNKKLAASGLAAALEAGLIDRVPGGVRMNPALRTLIAERFNLEVMPGLLHAAFVTLGEVIAAEHLAGLGSAALVRCLPALLALLPRIEGVPEIGDFAIQMLNVGAAELVVRGEHALGRKLARLALEIAVARFGEAEEILPFLLDLGRIESAIATRSWREERDQAAASAHSLYARALALVEADGRAECVAAGTIHRSVGELELGLGHFEIAIERFGRALAIARKNPELDTLQAAPCSAYLGECHRRGNRWSEAAAAFREAIALESKRPAPDPGYLASLKTDLGAMLDRAGDLAGARAAFEEAIPLGTRAFQTMAGSPGYGDFYAASLRLWKLAMVTERIGDDPAALVAYEAALGLKRVYSDDRDREVGHLHEGAGGVCGRLGELMAAEAHFLRAREVYSKARSPDHGWVGQVCLRLGELALARDDFEGARRRYSEAAAAIFGGAGIRKPEVEWQAPVKFFEGMARLSIASDDLPAARAQLTKGSRLIEDPVDQPSGNEASVRAMLDLAAAWRELGDLHAAWAVYARALEVAEPRLGAEHAAVEEIRRQVTQGRPAMG